MRNFLPSAGIVLRFTMGHCRALPLALARLSCFYDSIVYRPTSELSNTATLAFILCIYRSHHLCNWSKWLRRIFTDGEEFCRNIFHLFWRYSNSVFGNVYFSFAVPVMFLCCFCVINDDDDDDDNACLC